MPEPLGKVEEQPFSFVKEWYVFGDRSADSWNSQPSKYHTDEYGARKEAERLARKHPGVPFKVLACVTTYVGEVTVQERS